MVRVQVIAPLGARLVGPAMLELTDAQAGPRLSVLQKGRKKGEWRLPEGAAVTFKRGEVFGIDEVSDKQARAAFEVIDTATAAKAPGA